MLIWCHLISCTILTSTCTAIKVLEDVDICHLIENVWIHGPWPMVHGPWSMVLKSHCCLAKRHDKCPMSHATWYMTHSPCFTLSWLLTHENIYDYSRKSWTKERCSQKRCQQNSHLKREKLKGCHPKPIKWSKSYASSLNPKTTRLPWSQVLPLPSCQDTTI